MSTRCSVLTAVHDPERAHLAACLESVRSQSFADLEHVVVDDASTRPYVREMLAEAARRDPRVCVVTRHERGGIVAASSDALAAASGDIVALLDHDDVLDESAIEAMSAALATADVAYSDHDVILPDGRLAAPYYKPDFSPEQLRNQNYILHLVAARRELVDSVGGFRVGFDGAQDHDLLLRLSERTHAVAHVPRILYHWRQSPASVASDPGNKPWAFDAGIRAVAEHCARVGLDATVEAGRVAGTYSIRRRATRQRRVSVVIPTRGTSRPVWGVRRNFVVEAVRSVVCHATHPDIEFVIVYDDVTPQPVLDALRREAGDALRLVRYAEPFNFSRKVNVGVAASSGELLLVLNDDTELIEPASLEVMAAHLDDDEVGMVGPKLLFADGTIQDAGHVYNGHLLPALVGWRGDGPGPWQLRPLAVEREVSGVTAAAAMLRRDVFDAVGGFDESMPVNFNDVDLSLKVRASGRRIIWTPHASWYHFESQTRPPEASDEEFEAIDRRWHHEITHDPYYNPNLAPFRSDWLELPFRSGAPLVEPETTTLRWFRHRFKGFVMRKIGR
jgi:GT2 family glycosyltransferase